MSKPNIIKEICFLEDGRTIVIETGELAKQADGSALIRANNTILLATVVVSKEIRNDMNFLPLTIDYREKYYAGGKIPGGFIKREGKPSDEEILTMRLVDRVLRPTFSDVFRKEIQIMISLLSYDKTFLPYELAALAASAALSVAGIPFNGPISEVRIIRINGKFIINPCLDQLEKADLDLIVGASKKSIIMLEGEMKEIKEDVLIQAISIAHKAIKKQIDAQIKLMIKLNKKNYLFELDVNRKSLSLLEQYTLKKKLFSYSYNLIKNMYNQFLDKKTRSIQEKLILNNFKKKNALNEKNELMIDQFYEKIKKKIITNMILKDNIRLDNRTYKQIRPIYGKVNYLPGVHGSALFSRGETQSLTTVTLGSSSDANKIDNVIMEDHEKFYIHYNFPPFSTGEIRQIRGVSRREIGHGNLAKRALKNLIINDNPYTIRIVSDILESNGSSSMATVCASSLALMDAGIPLINPVSGIAMGLFINHNKTVILSDILGEEDGFGEMDFKITGTTNGITACQMDVKKQVLSLDILYQILNQALQGRKFILEQMRKILPTHRTQLKSSAPKIHIIKIPKKFIGSVIGPGGKVIQEIQSCTETNIIIEEKEDIGYIEIIGNDLNKIYQAIDRIKEITFVPKIGTIYKATVKNIKNFGVFVEISKGVEGLLHISEICWKRLKNIEDELNLGDTINVKLIGFDNKNHKMKFSRKVLLPKPTKNNDE
ncbi:polyribonucleotide nucleotidyltransferase [Blattabacterium cuenoti]|uniref:polyribonucleotide nucleotidyltransferase n=1 Tax=Blattabacterium cuenoti TaxID=1653831 RepID=UPI00163BE418|nr:polyribonucleotide nucleotidyltransferase [Blattabacterium cuenoti]